jgi:hypothetical protein
LLTVCRVVHGKSFFTGGIDVEDDWSAMYDFFAWVSRQREELGVARGRIDPTGWDMIRACMLNGGIRSWPEVYRKMIQ